MPVTARHLAVLALVGVLLVVLARQPDSPLWPGTKPAGFDDAIVAQAGATPNLYAEAPDVRIYQLISSMNGMWERIFAEAGDRYEHPTVEARGTALGTDSDSDCGVSSDDWAGIYCAKGHRIVIDVTDHTWRRAAVGTDRSDDILGYVLAHEIGHHVQSLRGVDRQGSAEDVLRAELHAQCLAGVWGRASGRGLLPEETYAADAAHGTVAQQRWWLERGHARGRPSDCDGAWSRAL